MNSTLEKMQRAIETPEVQEMIRHLSDYGLGVFMPHLHPEEGEMEPLPKGIVQVEKDLKVSFVSENDPSLAKTIPVGWQWDKDRTRVSASCYCCKRH